MLETASWSGFPRTKKGSGRLAFWITALAELALLKIDPRMDIASLWARLIGLPTCSGLLAALIYGWPAKRTYEECMRASQRAVASLFITVMVLCLLLLAIFPPDISKVPYMIAVIYSPIWAPLAMALAAAGGTLGYWIQKAVPRKVAAVMPHAEARS
jgi:hypothetical protein